MNRFRWLSFAVLAFFPGALGCGYGFQGSHSPLLDQENIRRIYVQPLINDTYKAGVENLVYNALVRTISAGRRVVLVRQPQLADAILVGRVNSASSAIASSTAVDSLTPQGIYKNTSVYVATVYAATLQCTFNLIRRNPPPGKKTGVWSSSFSRSKSYPAATQLDVPGTTSNLINESEFDRALGDLASSMMGDVHESMLAMF